MAIRVTFWGGTDTVTGSRFVVEAAGKRILVDCGQFQGVKALRNRNWEKFPVDPSSIDAVVLTHAHIDHSGYLPALVRDGFDGDIWCTDGTAHLGRILLRDSAYLQEEDAKHANRRKSSRHHPALPLFTMEDAEFAIERFVTRRFHETFSPVHGIECMFSPVGHILGASCLRISDGSTSVLFTGDVGRPDDPVMRAPEPPPAADHIVTESTYGNRKHGTDDPSAILADVVTRTVKRGGAVLIPVFAVGRAQMILHLLTELRHAGRIPHVPVYLNSPMAIDATELFFAHPGEHRLTDAECTAMRDNVELVRTAQESIELTEKSGPMIVLSASGMATGGRVLHHLERMAPDARNTIVIVGYQAAGTRGEALLNGADQLKMYGEYVPVNAEVVHINGLSAHADSDELMRWLSQMPGRPESVWIVHGEPAAADTFRRTLRDSLGWETHVPAIGETATLR